MNCVLIGLTLLFLLSFYSRFAGLRSGDGEYEGGMALLAAQMPYRDFFTAGPPLNELKSALILRVFGSALIVSRMGGVLERVLIALVLFGWLKRLFRPWHALAASFVTIVLSTGDLTDPIASYNHDAILFAMVSGLAANVVLESGSTFLPAILSGVFAALCLLTKQTIGLAAIACVGTAGTVLLAKLDGGRRSAIWLGGFAAGCAIPISAIATWLWKNHVLGTCLHMIFVAGPAAKAGHAADFLTRERLVAADNPLWVLPALVGVMLSWQAIQRGLRLQNARVAKWDEQAKWVLGATLLVGLAEAAAYTRLPAVQDTSKCAVYYTFILLTMLAACQLAWLLRSGMSRRTAQIILLSMLSWSVAVTLSMSWPVFEPMLIPGLGLLLAATLDGIGDRFKWFLGLTMAAMVFLQIQGKLDLPFGFDGEDEMAVRFATDVSVQPQLRDIRLPPPTVKFLDETVKLVAARTGPGDTIFTYPEMGLLYSLTGRTPPTLAGSHNIDVVNDTFAREEAARLTRARPAVVICYQLPETALREQERMWRGGKTSGQRDIIAAVQSLVGGYHLAGTYVLAKGDPAIEVYVRP
jgi:hypothetical protein